MTSGIDSARAMLTAARRRLHPSRVVFHHAPKCGGTSVGRALRKRFILSQATVLPEASFAAEAALTPDAPYEDVLCRAESLRERMLLYHLAAGVDCISAHVRFGEAAWRGFSGKVRFVTMLRDPEALGGDGPVEGEDDAEPVVVLFSQGADQRRDRPGLVVGGGDDEDRPVGDLGGLGERDAVHARREAAHGLLDADGADRPVDRQRQRARDEERKGGDEHRLGCGHSGTSVGSDRGRCGSGPSRAGAGPGSC